MRCRAIAAAMACCFSLCPNLRAQSSEVVEGKTRRIIGVAIGDFYHKWTKYGEWLRPDHLDLIRDSGGNTVKLYLNLWAWDNDVPVTPWVPVDPACPSMGYRDRLRQIIGWCGERDLLVILEMASGTRDEEHWEGKWQAKADFLMGNSTITKDHWIQSCAEIAGVLKPYGFGPFNEPPAGKDNYGEASYPQADLTYAYRDFISRTCARIHESSPETLCFVESSPFWDLTYFIEKPLPLSYVVYEIHPYPVDIVAMPITELLRKGDWAGAKALYKSYIEDTRPRGLYIGWGVREARAAGLEVYVGESGTNAYQVEWKKRLEIHYEVMDELGLGFVQLGFDGNSAFTGPNFYGMLENPWAGEAPVFNEIGRMWRSHALKAQ